MKNLLILILLCIGLGLNAQTEISQVGYGNNLPASVDDATGYRLWVKPNTNQLYFWNGSAWVELTPGSAVDSITISGQPIATEGTWGTGYQQPWSFVVPSWLNGWTVEHVTYGCTIVGTGSGFSDIRLAKNNVTRTGVTNFGLATFVLGSVYQEVNTSTALATGEQILLEIVNNTFSSSPEGLSVTLLLVR